MPIVVSYTSVKEHLSLKLDLKRSMKFPFIFYLVQRFPISRKYILM